MTNRTEGDWDFACDSYGKVRHSRKACVYTTVKKPGGDLIVTVAARVENWTDAKLMAAAPDLFEALVSLKHVIERDQIPIPAKQFERMKAAVAKALR